MSDEGRPDTPAGEDQSLALDFGAAPTPASPYRVLARKYRPSNFEELIGQEAMVRTLSNAFELDRIHQAYMLTGVRGVGKTTTARILARAFNYEVPAREGRPAIDRPTIHMPELGVHCQAIMESRHIDVLEMDAASHTGVDDIREIIENARFRPVSARTKVYIIDEVHMLSKAAFNALLKTLEEPPQHVKFLFATTEIEKVPVTVRSRCQRFDLRRVEAQTLSRRLQEICAKEDVAVESDALALIARAAEGSVRDALSLLDQAIAHGASQSDAITAANVNDMLGLADRGRIIDLFEMSMKGEAGAALAAFKEQYDQGADPGLVLADLAEFTHFVTGLKLSPQMQWDTATPEERRRGLAFANSLGVAALTRAWQILAKGIVDVKDSPRPRAAADMVLVRLAYAANLPSPEEALRRLASAPAGEASEAPRSQPNAPARAPVGAAPRPPAGGAHGLAVEMRHSPEPRVTLSRFEDLVALAQSRRDIQMKVALERDVRLVRFEEGALEFAPAPGASPQLAQILSRRLQEWTGLRWLVAVSSQPGAPTLKEQELERESARRVGVSADPLVRAVLERFPGAEIVSVSAAGPDEAPKPGLAREGGEDMVYADADAEDGDGGEEA